MFLANRRGEIIRFYLPVFLLGGFAVTVGVRLVMLHLDLVTTRPAQPSYEFVKYTKGRRGTVYSSGGLALAKTTTLWEYRLDPKAAMTDPDNPRKPIPPEKRMTKMRKVSSFLDLPLGKVMDAYARTSNRYQLLAVSDSQEVYDLVSNSTNHLREISIRERQARVYPLGHSLSQVVGYVNFDPEKPVGDAGIERRYERFLKGSPGKVVGIRDAVGREQRLLRQGEADAQPGCDVYLTIDHNLQYEVERILAEGIREHRAQRAWCIVISVKTGAILAMAGLPDYEPAHFNDYVGDRYINRAIAESYEPGSVMKTITACAVLNEGMVTPDTRINTARNDPRYYRLPGDAGHVWEETMTVRDALVHSSNIVFGKLGVDLGPKRMRGYMTAFGFGKRTGIELPGETPGILPPLKDWQKDIIKHSRAPIGQGVAVTAIQLAAAYAAVANDGTLLKPYLVAKVVDHDGNVVSETSPTVIGNPIRPSVARQVRQMMLGVAKKGGTAKRAAVPGYSVAGKTGTAQMSNGRSYSETDFHASFIGIIPAAQPEVVILVTYQKPLFCRSRATAEATGVPLFNHQGGLCAAPTFSKIAAKAMRYLEVQPDIPEEVPEDDFEDEP